MSDGVLGTQASLAADIVLLLEIAMGAGLLAGAWLARAKCYRQHGWCQSIIVMLNVSVIALTMAPPFARKYFGLATAHAALGSITELAALYVLLAAGTRLLPERLRLARYKLCMRTVLVLWCLVLFLGFATYARW